MEKWISALQEILKEILQAEKECIKLKLGSSGTKTIKVVRKK